MPIDNLGINQWRDELPMPYRGIKTAKAYRERLVMRNEIAKLEADELMQSFKDLLPKPNQRPIYLYRTNQKSKQPIRWKMSQSKLFQFQEKKLELDNVSIKSVITIFASVGVEKPILEKIIEIDFKRFYLNYLMNYTSVELARVEAFIEDFECWRKVPGLVVRD